MTHQPFQSWCEACVIGRSRQSPHAKAAPGEQEVKDTERPEPMIQIGLCLWLHQAEARDPGRRSGRPEIQSWSRASPRECTG